MTLRPVAPLDLPDVTPAVVEDIRPEVREVSPAQLFVDEAYQRSLSERSVRLIRKIVSKWDWRHFKPPVVVETTAGLHVIDGQHTAIAAATHGGIGTIPVLVVPAEDVATRARAFIGHNRDRITVTGAQLHFAALAAGDEDALTVEQVCRRAGISILKFPPANGVYEPGQTIAIATIKRLIDRLGAMKARQALSALAEARCAPASSDLMKASAELLFGQDYAGAFTVEDLATHIRAEGAAAERDARSLALSHRLPHWRALTVALYRRRKGRGSRSAA